MFNRLVPKHSLPGRAIFGAKHDIFQWAFTRDMKKANLMKNIRSRHKKIYMFFVVKNKTTDEVDVQFQHHPSKVLDHGLLEFSF